MGKIKNEVSYSESKARLLDECARRYWYQYYAAWNGWWHGNRPPASKKAEESYEAKHYDDVNTLAGRIVHDCAAWGLRRAQDGKEIDREQLRADIVARAARSVDDALVSARERRGSDPKKRTRLIELEFGLDFDEDELRDKVRNCVMALTSMDDAWEGDIFGQNLYVKAIERHRAIIEADRLMSYRLKTHGGVTIPVYLAVDLMMKGREPRSIVVIDWKTGKPRPKDSEQVIHYAGWAKAKNYENASMLLVYLGTKTVTTASVKMPFDEAFRQAFQAVGALRRRHRRETGGW